MSHSDAQVVDQHNKKLYVRKYPKLLSLDKMLYRNFVINSSAIYKYDKHLENYFEEIKHEDFLFWLMKFKSGFCSISPDEVLVAYRIHSQNFTKNKVASFLWHFNVWKKFGISWPKQIWYAIKNIFSRIIWR